MCCIVSLEEIKYWTGSVIGKTMLNLHESTICIRRINESFVGAFIVTSISIGASLKGKKSIRGSVNIKITVNY